MRNVLQPRLLAVLLIATSCSDPSEPPTPTSVVVVSGSAQSGVVATTLAQPVVVEVRDDRGRGIRGVNVTWTVTAGGGSVGNANSSTDASGRAQVQWTLGTTAGENRLTAGVSGISPAAVTATGTAGPADGIEIVAGSGQSGTAGTQLGLPLVARATDAWGNGVSGVSVSFSASAGTVQPASASTNSTGLAIAAWTLGPETGQQTVDALLEATSASVRFTATAVPPPVLEDIENDVPLTGLDAADKVDRTYRIIVPENAVRLTVTTTGGSGDADLYVRHGVMATLQQHDCRSTSPTTVETCSISNPAAGEWYILVHAWSAYSGVTLRAAHSLGGSLALEIAGVPTGATADVNVTGPGGYNRTVTASTVLNALVVGDYTVFAPNVVASDVVYTATPGTQSVTVAGGAESAASVTYAQNTASLNFDITGMYITQSVQRPDGSVPLIANRAGLLRVFLRANAFNTETPPLRVRTYHGGALVDTRVVNTQTPVPVTNDDGSLATTRNVVLPGSLIQPGMTVLVDVDPDNAVVESNESDNSFPAGGTPLEFTVRNAPVMEARFVPIVQPDGQTVDLTTGNVQAYFEKAQALYPVPSIDADVRQPYSFSKPIPAQYDSIWVRMLGEVLALRTADGSTRHYYGVIRPAYSSGGSGLGYIGAPAAVGVDRAHVRHEIVAHEWGHNFGRLHVGCGNPSNPDPYYPYTSRPGETGQHGWDPRTGQLLSKETFVDLMSYCDPAWISDYTYEAVMSYRGTSAAAPEPSLLVWGSMTETGVVLEPAFEMVTVPSLPQKSGPYRITGMDATGAQILSIAFDGVEIDHLAGVRHFSFAIPLRMLRGRELTELRLSGPSGEALRRRTAGEADLTVAREDASTVHVTWNAAETPALLVRDARTGAILTIARDGDARIVTRADELDVSLSNGVRSGARRVAVER